MEAESSSKGTLSTEFVLGFGLTLVNLYLDQADIHSLVFARLSIATVPCLLIDALRRTEWSRRVGHKSFKFASCCFIIIALPILFIIFTKRSKEPAAKVEKTVIKEKEPLSKTPKPFRTQLGILNPPPKPELVYIPTLPLPVVVKAHVSSKATLTFENKGKRSIDDIAITWGAFRIR